MTQISYRQRKADLIKQLLQANPSGSPHRVDQVLKALQQLTDNTLVRLWLDSGLDGRMALVAVGGYGRGQLFPHSDIDVLVLLPEGSVDDLDTPTREQLEGFITACWDHGLEIGSSVRTLSECLRESQADITVQTSMLESRLLSGDKSLFQQFERQFQASMDPRAFFIAKSLELRQRHNKYDNTPYSLEPNCKESPGGLRDLHIILWVAKAAGLGSTWDELGRNGLATPLEVRQLKRHEAVLRSIRAHLHAVAQRREDRLVFDLQHAVSQSLHLHASETTPTARAASEALMKRYYWSAKAVTQLHQILMLNIDEWIHRDQLTHEPELVNERFAIRAGMIDIVSDDLYQRQPHAILETFLVFQRTVGAKGLSARTLRALYNARSLMDGAFRRDPANRLQFLRILQQPEGVTHALRLMNQTSVLGRTLWAFRRIVGQMQHDLFHVYTVDQHILMVLRNVRRFFLAEHAHEYPFCSQLAAGWDKPWVLYVAALFHDIAKGRGGDHSELGRAEVRRFCKDFNIARDDALLIEFLVGEHLTMSHIAQKQDLSDPDVIQAFARRVGTERNLTALYLLTVADIRGTSPKVWNAWKGKLLEDLYRSTLRALGGHAADANAEIEARKREALTLLALHALPFEAHKDLWDTLDVGYFMRHEASDIAWHTRQISLPMARARAQSAATPTLVRARISPLGEGLQVMVYTPDQEDLFARICGYFDHAGFSILDAKIHTARNGYALDTFQVVTPMLQEHYRELLGMVESELARTLDTQSPLPAVSRGRVSRRVKSFPVAPRVSLEPDEKAQRWLLSISTSDRAGLLYSVALVLARHKINVLLAKISTLGERVEDTFLVDGAALQNNRTQLEIETELLQALSA
jgi:[protein-PII] uridylyltransferase